MASGDWEEIVKARQEIIDAAERLRLDAERSHDTMLPVSVLNCIMIAGALEWTAGIGSRAAQHFQQAIDESYRQARARGDDVPDIDPSPGFFTPEMP